MRLASVNFDQVQNMRFAASHAFRTQLHPPGYLLDKEHRLGNLVVDGSLTEEELVKEFSRLQQLRTGQAKARRASAVWEGILVLPDLRQPVEDYLNDVNAKLKSWSKAFEDFTGCRVLAMVVHLDEGVVHHGVHYNTHAHVFVDRLNGKKQLYSPGRLKLSQVQDLTAEAMGMRRGETLAQRRGRRGRKHMHHKVYRSVVENLRQVALASSQEASNEAWEQAHEMLDAKQQQLDQQTKSAQAYKAEIDRAWEAASDETMQASAYSFLRGFVKGKKVAAQSDYTTLREMHEAEDPLIMRLAELAEEESIEPEDVIKVVRGEDLETLLQLKSLRFDDDGFRLDFDA